MNDAAMHVRQAEVATGVAEREALMVETPQMQQSGMQVVAVGLVLALR